MLVPGVSALPKDPRLPEALRIADHGDLDPEYPDLDSVELTDEVVSLPDARAVTILRSRLTDTSLEVDPSVPIEIHDSVLAGVDLTGHRITGLSRVRLERCRLGGADLGDARVRDVVLEECVLDLSAWRNAQLERVSVGGGRIDGVDLTGAQLQDVTIAGVALTEVVWDGVRAEGVDLTAADVAPVPDLTDLRGCTISPAQAVALALRSARALGLLVRVDE